MKRITLLSGACALSATMLLAACGGSDDEPVVAVDPTVVPSSATASVNAMIAFAKALMSSETSEALALTGVGTLPVSDTDEPAPVQP